MDWTTRPLSRASSLTANPFSEGDRVISFIVRGQEGELERLDYLESELSPQTMPAAEVLGRWVRTVKPAPASKKEAREQETAGTEEMFVALCEMPQEDSDEDRSALIKILDLTLERRRVLRAVGPVQDGFQRYMHLATKAEYNVRILPLTPELILRVQPQLPGAAV